MDGNVNRTIWPRMLLLAAVAAAAVALGVFWGHGAPGAAEATGCWERYDGVQKWGGMWAQRWTDCNGSTRHWPIVDANGYPVPIDAPKPDYETEFNEDGSMTLRAVYAGDTVQQPYCATADGRETHLSCSTRDPGRVQQACPGCGEVRTWLRLRAVTLQAPRAPLVNQPGTLRYQADADNRVVIGEDGQYYREWRVSGHWLRSTPYGADADALARARRTADNASQVSQLLRSGRSGSSSTPFGNSGSNGQSRSGTGSSPVCEEQFADLPPGQRALICAGV
ncbi:MAG: hypothetical protein OXI83_02720 [Gemmatimonadota bacterium]|nr:hypothetical protein [Gemmatimonadota bacterium]